MKRLITFITHIAFLTNIHAVPAYRGPIEKTQADGSTITLYQHGDEHFHYFTLADGTWVRENAQGMFEKAEKLSDVQIEARRSRSRYKASSQIQTASPLNIAPRGLIILVNFSDVTFNATNTLQAMQEMHNGDHYTYNGATGSARQYFSDQSFGQYIPQFDVVGPVTLSKTMSYYGQNDSNGDDRRVDELVTEACKLADTQCGVNFSNYDNNNDGDVDFVYFIYAGYNEAEGASKNTIWPHAYWLYSGYGITLRLDGKRIDTYACSSELRGTNGNLRCGIGTFCHEFSHVLGLPDLYATNDASHHTMGAWDILDYGPYNNNGLTPPAYSAYERFFMGWLRPTILNAPATVTLENLNDSKGAAIITSTGTHNLLGNDPNPTEFFVLENRQKKGWDAYLPGHGMLITKIKYSYTKWRDNTVNNTANNMGVDIMEANGNVSSSGNGKSTDVFPTGNTYYTPYTKYPITQITEDNGIINFLFMGGGENLNITLLEDVLYTEDEQVIAIYNMLGQLQGTTDIQRLEHGLYIVKTTVGTKKISIR